MMHIQMNMRRQWAQRMQREMAMEIIEDMMEAHQIIAMEGRRRQMIAAQMQAAGLAGYGMPFLRPEMPPMGVLYPSMNGPRAGFPGPMGGMPFDPRFRPPPGFGPGRPDQPGQRDPGTRAQGGDGEPEILYGEWEVEEVDENEDK
jgi:hypothetical protein